MLRQERGLPPSRLEVAGYLAPEFRPYLHEIEQHLRDWGLADEFHYRGTVDAAGAVNLRHTNNDGSMAILTAEISNNHLIGSMRRGPCIWDVKLAKR